MFIGPKSAKFQALLILQKEIYIFFSGSSGEYSEQDGITPEELANNPESKVYLGVCNVDNAGEEKLFDTKNAELATTTCKKTFVCDGSKWRQKDD